jgi:hypothetical protein
VEILTGAQKGYQAGNKALQTHFPFVQLSFKEKSVVQLTHALPFNGGDGFICYM